MTNKISKRGRDTLIISPMSMSGVVEGTLMSGWGAGKNKNRTRVTEIRREPVKNVARYSIAVDGIVEE